MSIYSQFKANEDLETQGFALELIDDEGKKSTFILARAGGGNKKFTTALKAAMRPFAQMPDGQAKDRISEDRTIEVMAKHIVLAWENVIGKDGELIEYTPENCLKLLKDLPDLAEYLITQANTASHFLEVSREADAKG